MRMKKTSATDTPFYGSVYRLVRLIPRGKVASYGQLAMYLGDPRGARTVGWAMRVAPEDVPWHRVINAQGRIIESGRGPGDVDRQRALLESEGVCFTKNGRIDLARHLWEGPEA
jgi:methylated-DNA-protein-cysteine methyltransferase-like protein